jgi:diphosphomevalonate decarboxylase
MTVIADASPSLALTKYWGKRPGGINIPETSSVAVTLGALHSRVSVAGSDSDRISVDGAPEDVDRFRPVLDAVRSRAGRQDAVAVRGDNDFPTAAGLASSSSGFAAMAVGLDAFFGTSLSGTELSQIARLGSGSAARAVFGGFTVWPAGASCAEPFATADHWPELRVIAVVLAPERKSVSSRAGMENSRKTSAFYQSWSESAEPLFTTACDAVLARDLEKLGTAMRQSYLGMFATMFSSEPPLIYWRPESLALIHQCEAMRSRGIAVWETMDAGPQVKLVTVESEVSQVVGGIHEILPEADYITSPVGGGPSVRIDKA